MSQNKHPEKYEKVTCESCHKEISLKDSSLYFPAIKAFSDLIVTQKLNDQSKGFKDTWNGKSGQMPPIRCQQCISNKHIIIADRKKQETHWYLCFGWYNILYYQDKTLHCKSCKKDFLFSASEQQYWYEEAQIFTDVQPKFCAPCRKKNRQQTAINKKLMSLTQKETFTKDDIEQIVEIYTQLWNKTQAGIYKAKLKQWLWIV